MASKEFYHYNAVGHTVALSDSNALVTKTTAYDAYGNVAADSGQSDNNRLANTKERDASLGLDNHGFRYYDPTLGRYLTRDPIGYADGLNNYLHVHNNPVNAVDPLGLEADTRVWHHLLSREHFDPANTQSLVRTRNLSFEGSVDIHSAKYGWMTPRGHHDKIVHGKWNADQRQWLKSQPRGSVITREMLDDHLASMKDKYKLSSRDRTQMSGGPASGDWDDKKLRGHYRQLSVKGVLDEGQVTRASLVPREATHVRHANARQNPELAQDGKKVKALGRAIKPALAGLVISEVWNQLSPGNMAAAAGLALRGAWDLSPGGDAEVIVVQGPQVLREVAKTRDAVAKVSRDEIQRLGNARRRAYEDIDGYLDRSEQRLRNH